jgi:MYXO-CTERM domain-containing protein
MPGAGGSSTGGTMTAAGGAPTGMPLSTGPTEAEPSGCGCHVPAKRSSVPLGALAAVALGLAVARRRRR